MKMKISQLLLLDSPKKTDPQIMRPVITNILRTLELSGMNNELAVNIYEDYIRGNISHYDDIMQLCPAMGPKTAREILEYLGKIKVASKNAAISMGDAVLKSKLKKELEKSKVLDSMINSIIRDFSAGVLQDPYILQNKYPGIGTNASENIMAILWSANE